MALEIIANSDAPYHDLNHTIAVTLVGQEILKGKHLREGGVSPRDWLQFTVALLCHDIGYVRGVCQHDRDGRCVINAENKTVSLAPGATDAALAPYHVERGQIFVRERFGDNPHIDVETVCANIEYTQFPVPEQYRNEVGPDYPVLLRAADLIGQLGYQTSADLRAAYPAFFWNMVGPYIGGALRYLRMTQNGKQWVANLYAHLFAEEHDLPSLGAERIEIVRLQS